MVEAICQGGALCGTSTGALCASSPFGILPGGVEQAMKSAPEHANPSDELRSRMRETWDAVHRLLTDPVAPRRDARGRTIHQVLQDMILESFDADRARMH
jgi:hypothetical protein